MAKNMKRIHKVVVKRMVDESPDTSWLGEYANRATGDFSIDRVHDRNCPLFWANDDNSDDDERDCDCSGVWDSREYRYFNPGSVEAFNESADWLSTAKDKRTYWFESMQGNAIADYERSEAINRGEFCFLGIRAEAEYVLTDVMQNATSGGLWGIESDSDADYLKSVEDEELVSLREQLKAIGFSGRAISAAFKTVERKDAA